MKDRPFAVRYDPVLRRLHWTIRGFWTMADVDQFASALVVAIQPLGLPPYYFDGLCNARDFPVQSAEISGALGEIERVGYRKSEGRKAIVVGSMMNKLQAERTLTSPGVRIFLSMDDALAWLNDVTT